MVPEEHREMTLDFLDDARIEEYGIPYFGENCPLLTKDNRSDVANIGDDNRGDFEENFNFLDQVVGNNKTISTGVSTPAQGDSDIAQCKLFIDAEN
jgi:hypothetical protein